MTPTDPTLTEFLTDRLDEAAARLPAVPRAHSAHTTACTSTRCDPLCPTFARDRIVADRAIVAAHTSTDGELCDECWGLLTEFAPTPWPCPTLRWLARPYHAHPDYRTEWAVVEDRP